MKPLVQVITIKASIAIYYYHYITINVIMITVKTMQTSVEEKFH